MRKSLNILIIAPNYVDFIKDSTESIAKYVNGEITVMVRYNILVEFLRYVPFGGIFDSIRAWYTKEKLLDIHKKPKNVNIHLLPMVYIIPDGKNTSLGDKIANKAEKLIQKNRIKFDLIHAHFTWPCGYAGVRLAKEYNTPVVITLHENREWFLKEYHSKNEKIYWTWRNADALIRVNKKDVPLLKEFNPNVYSIPNGFNPNKFRVIDRRKARVHLGLPQDKKIIFSLGNLIERKGFQYLIEAMKNIVKVRTDVLCLIGGSGSLEGKLKKQIKELGLQGYVKLLGYVPNEELSLWMNAADIFVLPSLSEGNPTVMFEALGVGLPFVGTTVGGVPEIITSEDYGLLCPPADPECLAEKILIALEREWNREKIRKYAKQFTWEEIAKRIWKVYQKAL